MKTHSTTGGLSLHPLLLSGIRPGIAVLTLAVQLSAVPALGSPAGDLDPAFGDHGRILLRDPEFGEISGVGVFPEAGSDRLLVLGNDWQQGVLLRFNADGSVDRSFGNQGKLPLDFGNDRAYISDSRLLVGGRLLVAGAVNVYGDSAGVLHSTALLARMHADGSPDTSFGSNGRATFELGGVYEGITETILQPDGQIVVLGGTNLSGTARPVLARYSSDGQPDASFGSAATPGFNVIEIAEAGGVLVDVARQDDGSFMICGYVKSTGNPSSPSKLLAMRMNANGTTDVSFGNNGIASTGGWQTPVRIQDCLLLADGHLMMAGDWDEDINSRGVVFRLTPDGRLDEGFGSNGMVTLPTTRAASTRTMLTLADGSLAVAGAKFESGENPWSDMLLARIDPTTGEFDQAFGDAGVMTADFGADGFTGVAAPARVIQQEDGKLVLVGAQIDWYDWYPASSLAMARVDPYGSGSNGFAGVSTTLRAVRAEDRADITVRRTGGFTGQLSVSYATLDGRAIAGSDYVAQSGTLVWEDGDSSDRTLLITTMSPGAAGYPKWFSVELFDSSGGLANNRADVGILAAAPPKPPTSPVQQPRGASGGSGAAGIEIFLLLALRAFRTARLPNFFGGASRKQSGARQYGK